MYRNKKFQFIFSLTLIFFAFLSLAQSQVELSPVIASASQELVNRADSDLASLQTAVTSGERVTPTLSHPVRELPDSPVYEGGLLQNQRELGQPHVTHHGAKTVPTENLTREIASFLTPSMNITGTEFSGVNPPDTVGAIGKDHYIQMVNSTAGARFVVYDRSGAVVKAATALDSMGSGNCANGGGNPMVLYDQLADRWFMSEHNATQTLKTVCHYISQSADPLGAWYAYEFVMPSFPDIPKYSLWPDVYVGAANETNPTFAPAIYAFDRNRMLAGEPASFIRFTLPALSGYNFQAFTPVDMDGLIQPPAGSPPLYLRHVDDEVHDSSDNATADFIEIWSLTPNFDIPAASTFIQVANVPIAEFDSSLCGIFSFQCVPQPGTTTKLDPVREFIMHRVAYMNFVTHQSIVGNMVTDVTGSDLHGIKWFELRNTHGTWELYQEGTFSLDDQHRWMGSIGIDSSENIALLYNVSGDSTYPSLRYTGRTHDMSLGSMLVGEGSIAEGDTSNSSSRYGDHTALTLDPFDGCTFWATGQYNPSVLWGTRIATFKFPDCEPLRRFLLTPVDSEAEFLQGELATVQASVSTIGTFTDTVSFSAGSASSGTILSVQPQNLIPSSMPVTVTVELENGSVGEQSVVLTGTSTEQTELVTLTFTVVPTLTESVMLISPADGETYVDRSPRFAWSAVSGATGYELQLVDGSDFSSAEVYTDITSTQFDLPTTLLIQVEYSWRVRPVNQHSQGPWAVGTFVTDPPIGQCMPGDDPVTVYATSFEDGLLNWETTNSGGTVNWTQSTDRVTDGTYAAKGPSHTDPAFNHLISPPIFLSLKADARWMMFDVWRSLEGSNSVCYDGLMLDIWKGGQWDPLGHKSTNDPYDAAIATELNNPFAGEEAWCGNQDWTRNIINLEEDIGESLFRFTVASDNSLSLDGVYIDNLMIYECNPSSLDIFLPLLQTQ